MLALSALRRWREAVPRVVYLQASSQSYKLRLEAFE